MRPNLDHHSSPRGYLARSVKTEAHIPRSLANIPSDQKKLLARSDSWAEDLQGGPQPMVNVPPEVLEQIKYSYLAHILPPAGQKPHTSSAPEPTYESHSVKNGDLESVQASDNASEVSWSPSPSPAGCGRRNGSDSPVSIRTTTGRFNSQEPEPVETVFRSSSTSETPHATSSGSLSKLAPEFLTQLVEPLPSSPEKLGGQAATPNAHQSIQSSNLIRRTGHFFLPSSAGTEEDLPMQTPGAIEGSPSRVNKDASRAPGVEESSSASFDNTPFLGLTKVIPGTLLEATPPISRSIHRTRWSGIGTPPCGQGDVIKSTYPDNRMDLDEPGFVARSQNSSSTTDASKKGDLKLGRRTTLQKMQRIRFEKDLVAQDSTVLIENTPAQKLPSNENRPPQQSQTSSPTTPIESTFPAETAALNGVGTKKPEVSLNAAADPTQPALTPAVAAPEEHASPMTREATASEKTPKDPSSRRATQEPADNTVPKESVPLKTSEAPVSEPIPRESADRRASEASASENIHKPTSPTQPPNESTAPVQQQTALMPAPEPDYEELFWTRPYEAFTKVYPTFKGGLGIFVRACICIRTLRQKRRLPIFLYDDFVRVFCDDYLRYVEGTGDDEPLIAMDWYVENVRAPAFQKGVISNKNFGRVFRVHQDVYKEAMADLGGSPALDDQFSIGQAGSRMVSERRSVARTDLSGPVTTTSLLQLNVTPPIISRKRRSSMLSSVENVPHEFRIDGFHYNSPDLARHSSGKKRRVSTDSSHDEAESRQMNETASSSRSASRSAKSITSDPTREQSAKALRPGFSFRNTDWSGQFRHLEENNALSHESSVALKESTGMSRPQGSVSTPARRLNDHNETTVETSATTRTLPSGWNSEKTIRRPSALGPRPSSPAPSVLTQASGIKKRRKKLPTSEEYKARLEKLKASGRFSNGASSSAP